jgi:purine-cytosine permease-like protein
VPFFSTSLYTGPVADALGGADISFLVGLPVAAVCYYALTRRTDFSAERTLIDAESRRGPSRSSALEPAE